MVDCSTCQKYCQNGHQAPKIEARETHGSSEQCKCTIRGKIVISLYKKGKIVILLRSTTYFIVFYSTSIYNKNKYTCMCIIFD
jgi:hypothetical protein